MGQGATAFLSGILVFQQLPFLPPLAWAWLGVAAAALAWRCPVLRFPAWFIGGFLWTLLHAHHILSAGLPVDLEGQDLLAEGVIAAVPEGGSRATRFEFDVERLSRGDEVLPVPGRIRLSWYDDAPALAAGERWRLKVRLKRPRGFANPGAFDYEGWLYRKRIRATGYVRADPLNGLVAEAGDYPLQRLRQRIGERIVAALPERELRGVVLALAIGDYQYIERAQWEVFRRTGTTHLVAISGMHVSMIAGLLFVAVRWAWARGGTGALRWPAPHAAAIAGMIGALGYAALAGFSVPTQRAVVMVAAVMTAILLRRGRALFHTFMTALLLVLLYDPLAVMDSGFWLSFGAVATILFGMSARVGAGGWWWRWGRLHVLITIGLAPALLVLFQQLPLGSPIANFIAVPWVSLAVPFVLLGTALLGPLPALGALILGLAEWMLSLLWPLLDAVAGAAWLQWSQHAPAGPALALALAGVVLLLAPRGLPGRWLGVLFLLPAVLVQPARPAPGEVWFTLLDVGQGLSAVVTTSEHVLVYDTGARFSPDFDAGSAVVLPYLRHRGLRSIDVLLVSHGDNDHVGGAAAVLREMPVGRIVASEAHRIPERPLQDCADGLSWEWDGVRFDVVPPPHGAGFRRNDASCVLFVEAGGARILLPGDIEARSEALLLRSGRDLGAQVLVAPHHGSRTSSTLPFVRAVAPRYVLFPVGYRNRWSFPHAQVVARYEEIGASLYGSAEHGAITVRISAAGDVEPPRLHRERWRRYWQDG